MVDRDLLVRLPDRIELTLREAGTVLLALDQAFEGRSGVAERSQMVAARKLLTDKLWPELGELLDEPDAGEEA